MFSFIRRHQFLAMIFILLVIASFVVFFAPDMQRGGSKVDLGSVNGRPIGRQEYAAAIRQAHLTHFFRFQDWPRAGSFSEQMGWNTEEQARQYLLLSERLKEMNIRVGEEAVAKQVAQMFRGANDQGTVQELYRNFVDTRLKPQGITEEDLHQFIRHDLGIQQLRSVMSASGHLITPAVGEMAYRYENQRVEAKAVIFSTSNFVAKAKAAIDPKALTQYYSNQVQNYYLPTRVQVSYVPFESINYLAEAAQTMARQTNVNQIVEQLYSRRGTNAFTDEKGVVLPPDKAKEKIRDEIRKEEASRLARQKAYDFATELQDMEPLAAANLGTLAGKKGLKVFETEPFSAIDGPKGIKEANQFSQQAFALNREQPFGAEPVRVGDDYYVLSFKNRLPSMPQPFEVVKDKVQEDYVQFRAAELAREAGAAFARAVTNAVASGKKFAEVAKDHKVNVINLAPFARTANSIPELDAARISPVQFRSAAFAQKAGQSSGFISSGEGGFVVYVEKFLPADEEKMKTELKDFVENLRFRQAGVVLNEWMSTQMPVTGQGTAGRP